MNSVFNGIKEVRDSKKNWLISILFALFLIISITNLFPQEKTIAIRGGKFITVTKGIIENGILLIQEGKIAAIGKNVSIPKEAKIIDATKYTVLPGLIDSFTNVGTAEIEEVEKDYDEATSPLTPHLRIIDALNPENSFIPLARKRGITSVLSAPGEGNLLSGQSALIHLSGSTVEEMVIKFPVGMHASLGEAPKLRYGQKDQIPSTRMGEAALLRQTLINARDYVNRIISYEKRLKEYRRKEKEGKAPSLEKPVPPPIDFKLQSLLPVIKRELPLIVRANRLDDILTALRIADEFRLKIVLNHGAEAYKVADILATRKIPVLVGPTSSYYQKMETRKATNQNALLLQKAGVKIAFQTGSVQNFSDLLYQAELAVSYGLAYDEALKALTLYPAQIFGVEDRLGSLEEEKIADIVIFDGDPLRSLARIKMVIIKGHIVEDFF